MKNQRGFYRLSSWTPATTSESPAWFGPPWLLATGPGDPKKTVRVERRRRSEPAGEAGRPRAEAPQRRRADEPPPRPPSGTGGGARPPFRPSMPSGPRRPISIGLLLVLLLCTIPIFLFLGPGDSGENPPAEVLPLETGLAAPAPVVRDTPRPTATSKPVAFTPAAVPAEGHTWLVMLYQDADDKILEKDIYVDLNEAERVGSSERIHIVAQVDRFKGGYQGDGNWSTTKRFYITQDNDLERVGSQVVADLGEVNMSDGQTLVDFVTWAIENFPADKHVLIMSDHGIGWPGGWSDPSPGGRADPNLPISAVLGDQLYLSELDEALAEIRRQTGLQQFELIGLDACLMAHLEVFSALAPHARYAVASQETEPALGWAYTGFLEALKTNPDMNGAELSRLIVDSYIQADQRIVDEQARADLLRQGSPLGGLFGFGSITAAQLARQMEQDITLTAVDLAALPELIDRVNDLAFNLQEARQPVVAQARTYAQSFTSVFGRDVPPSYIDLGNFVQLLSRASNNNRVTQAADQVLASLNQAVIAKKHGPRKPGATGISIYFPNSQLYRTATTGAESYTVAARRFADISLWDDFLAYHYTGRSFGRETGALAVPERGAPISAPGAGQIELSPLTLSADVAAPGRPVLLSTDISGQNVGYVYLFVGFYDQQANSIYVADTDYLESADTREVDGVYYPDWGEAGEFTMEFEWEPVVFAISDGVNSAPALFTPRSYGVTFEEATYTVDGLYTYTDSGESRNGHLYFRDGQLRQVFGFTGEGDVGAPHEIIPQAGDTFTVLEKWMDLDQNGRVAHVTTQTGASLTFGEQPFTWQELDAAAGDYIVGFIVEDLDGNSTEVYKPVRVE